MNMYRADGRAKVIGHLKVIAVKVKLSEVSDVKNKLVVMSSVKRV